jgi:hypothetical protein
VLRRRAYSQVMNRTWALLAAAAAALAGAAGAVASAPPEILRAVERTQSLGSARLALVERISVGGQTVTVRLQGIEQPRTHAGSFVLTTTPAQAGLAKASEIVHGGKVYVHLPVLDALHAKDPRVQTWVVVDEKSSLGVDPSGLALLGASELQKLRGVHVVGHGSDGGVAVTRYAGTLDLKAISSSPQVQQLLAHLPSSAASVLAGTERLELAVGADGFVHRLLAAIRIPIQGAGAMQIRLDGRLSSFEAASAAIVPPPPASVMTLARFNSIAGVAAPADSALLDKVVLKASQVGAGYVRSEIPGGRRVQGERTLDFCGLSYPSESLRSARLQVAYAKRGASFRASNEVVTYRSGGAAQALREVTAAVARCPNGLVKSPPSGVTKLERHTRVLHDSRLLPGAVAVLDVETGIVKGKRVTLRTVAVYQVRGDVLSGVYGVGATDAAVQAATLRLAERSAANLKRVVPAASQTS